MTRQREDVVVAAAFGVLRDVASARCACAPGAHLRVCPVWQASNVLRALDELGVPDLSPAGTSQRAGKMAHLYRRLGGAHLRNMVVCEEMARAIEGLAARPAEQIAGDMLALSSMFAGLTRELGTVALLDEQEAEEPEPLPPPPCAEAEVLDDDAPTEPRGDYEEDRITEVIAVADATRCDRRKL